MDDYEDYSGFGPPPEIEQDETMDFLTHPIRHRVLQVILSHPDHLVSETEFDQYIPRSKPAIQDALDDLIKEGIVNEFRTTNPDNSNERDYPTEFVGLTPQGVQTLAEYNFLGPVPVLRAVFDKIDKDETQEQHLRADRPDLPEEVHDMLMKEGETDNTTDSSASKRGYYSVVDPESPTLEEIINTDYSRSESNLIEEHADILYGSESE
jgi:hypothetical protein